MHVFSCFVSRISLSSPWIGILTRACHKFACFRNRLLFFRAHFSDGFLLLLLLLLKLTVEYPYLFYLWKLCDLCRKILPSLLFSSFLHPVFWSLMHTNHMRFYSLSLRCVDARSHSYIEMVSLFLCACLKKHRDRECGRRIKVNCINLSFSPFSTLVFRSH